MKKIVLLLLCIIAILALPFAIGFISQQRSITITEKYRSNSNINTIESQFQRGWFHSNITFKTSLYLPSISDKNINIVVHQSMRQGPILWGNNRPLAFGFADLSTTIELPKDLQKRIHQSIGQTANISLLSQLHYDGSQDSKLFIPAFTHQQNDMQFTMHALTLTEHNNLDLDHVHGIVNWQGMEFTGIKSGQQVKLVLGKSTLNFNLQKHGVIWTGNSNGQTAILKLLGKAKQLIFNDLNIDVKTNMDHKQRISSHLSMHVGHLNNDHVMYDLGQFTIALKHIPLTLYEKIQELQDHVAKLPSEQRQQALQGMGFSMFSVLPDILASEPIIELSDASLNTPNGNMHAELRFSLLGLTKQDMMNFTKIKRHIQADIQISFPSALLKSSDMQKAETFIKRGWLIKQGHMLHGSLHMTDGILTINKQTISLPF